MASTDTNNGNLTPPVRGAAIPVKIGRRRFNQSYGRLVGWLKILLPTLAVVLLALLALLPYLQGEGHRLTDVLTGAADLVTEHMEVNQARYSGVSEDGQRYTVTAETVQQESVDAVLVAFIQPRADIYLNDDSWVLVTAETGTLDRETQVMELQSAVNLFHDLGYEFRTESATFDLMEGSAYGFDPIFGQGPFGFVEAQGFHIFNRGERVELTGHAKIQIYNTD